ncbi:MAG TPA: glutamate--tRNA ligase family protein, partial [Nitrososphaerales archaeon]|nr:glutamate--tRNA ligase family protein [Nitrososphaerales archaeon]
ASAPAKEGRTGLPPLHDAVKGHTAFRLPPEPSGFMTIGHAMAFTINFVYKETYDGELWLRFEDTNPRKVETRYYESFRKGISWLSIVCDHEKNVSDDIPLVYDYGRRLVAQGDAYACSCDEAKVKKLRFEGVPCEHRSWTVERNLEVWDGLVDKKYKEGEFVIRMKGDMANVNYSLRDTNLFRVIDRAHPLTGNEFSLWPTYDIANAVEDEVCGITHVLRSSEFRNELQQTIREKLGFRKIEVIQFSRFNFKGTPVAKRLLRPLVEKKLVTGWDDPRMPTVEGQRRRGILPQSIRDFTLQVGYTKTEHEYDWSLLLSINRKLLDPISRRYFFVPDPVKIMVGGAPQVNAKIPYHPQADLGEREIRTEGVLYVPGADLEKLAEGSVFRLMDLYNVKLEKGGRNPRCTFAGADVTEGTRRLQWVGEDHIKAKVLVPGVLFDDNGDFDQRSLKEVDGLVEASFGDAEVGSIVQFPRFGFARLDAPGSLILAS